MLQEWAKANHQARSEGGHHRMETLWMNYDPNTKEALK